MKTNTTTTTTTTKPRIGLNDHRPLYINFKKMKELRRAIVYHGLDRENKKTNTAAKKIKEGANLPQTALMLSFNREGDSLLGFDNKKNTETKK